ncbi:MAG: hypothetical protein P8Z36_08760 [Gemmatimonadota bacterium]|jgi:hypothetical protein
MSQRAHMVVLVFGAFFLLAFGSCTNRSVDERRLSSTTVGFDDAFQVLNDVVLEQSEKDSIADVGAFSELPDGSLIVADRLLPRIRHYTNDGRFLAASGSFGSGPYEFRGINGVAPTGKDELAVVDVKEGRLVILRKNLTQDTMYHLPLPPSGPIAPLENDLIMGLWGGRTGLRFYRVAGDSVVWGIFAPPPEVLAKPYWGSTSLDMFTVAGNRVFAANSLLYPIHVFNARGEEIGQIGSPPPSFHKVPEVPAGYFAGPASGEKLKHWTAQFTVMGRLATIESRFLVVSHARLSSEPRTFLRPEEYAVDLYDLTDGHKVFEDIPLPSGSRVLGGGRFLYVLVSQAPDPWRIMEVRPKVKN